MDRAREAHEKGKAEFRDALWDNIPPGIPKPNGSMRITQLRIAQSLTLRAYTQAVRQFTDFVLDRRIPERLSDSGTSKTD